MAINPSEIWVFRMVQIHNLEFDLRNGLFSKNSAPTNIQRVVIGSEEISMNVIPVLLSVTRRCCERLCSVLFLRAHAYAL